MTYRDDDDDDDDGLYNEDGEPVEGVKVDDFGVKKMCANCPFRARGAIDLQPGRVEGIIQDLHDDMNVFACHKTLDAKKVSGCMGALSYMYKFHGILPVAARVALILGVLEMTRITDTYKLLRDELCLPKTNHRLDASIARRRMRKSSL